MSADQNDTRLGEALAEWLEAAEAGRPPDEEAFLARHAGVADDLRRHLADWKRFHGPGTGRDPNATEADAFTATLPPGQPLGDFRLVRELGRGGMGVVYEAEQLSLGRRVALKVLPFAATMDDRQLRRFQNEARAAAALEHPHIVPVYGVGCERAVHFYAMRLIDGETLAALIARHRPAEAVRAAPADPTAPVAAASTETAARDVAFYRRAAEWGVQAAEALEYAHGLGVVHRDVKPANLMIDAAGKLWVTDFGLARTAADSGLTMTGDLLGTLRYMSPEQALARHGLVDHRTDVYALGATLYELLTGRPAVGGTDRQEVLRRIAEEDPVPPRRVNAAIPADLETITLKALAKEPGERYATAGELAADLGRFLRDEPVRARRPTLGQRARKWAWRNRAVVTMGSASAFAVLAVAVVLLAVSNVWVRREQAETEKERGRTAAALGVALDALDAVYVKEVERRARRSREISRADREYLELGLGYYEKLAERGGQSAELRHETAKAHRRVGDLQSELGRWSDAAASFRKALPTFVQLAADWPDARANRWELAACRQGLATSLRRTGGLPEAERLLRAAVAGWEAIVAEAPAGRDDLLGLTRARRELVTILALTGQAREAEGIVGQAVKDLAKLVAEAPREADCRLELTRCRCKLALLLRLLGRHKEADGHWKKAIGAEASPQEVEEAWREQVADADALVAAFPRMPQYRQGLGHALWGLGAALARGGRPDEALACRHRALEVFTGLAKDHPTEPFYRQEMAFSHRELASHHWKKQPQKAAEHFRKAVDLYEGLAAEHPGAARYRYEAIYASWLLGRVLLEGTNRQEAERPLRVAAAGYEGLLAGAPANQVYLEHAVQAWDGLVSIRGTTEDRGRAAALRLRLAAVVASADLYAHAAAQLERLGRSDEAAAAFRQALKLRPDHAGSRKGLDRCLNQLLNEERAFALLIEALRNPGHPKAWPGDPDSFEKRATREQLVAAYLEAVRRAPVLAAADHGLRDALKNNRELVGSVIYPPARSAKSEELDRHRVSALSSLDKGRTDAAIREGRDAIKLVPEVAAFSLRQSVATALWRPRPDNYSSPVSTTYRPLLAWRERTGWAYLILANALSGSGQPEEARTHLEEGMGFGPNSAEYHAFLARYLVTSTEIKLRDPARAVWHAQRAVLLAPRNIYHWMTLGLACWMEKRWQEAIAAYDEAHRVAHAPPGRARWFDVDKANSKNSLAWALSICPESKHRDPARAVGLAKGAVLLSPKTGAFWNTLGVAYYRAGQWKEAIAALEESMKLSKGGDGGPVDWLPLAMSHWRLGDKERARSYLQRAKAAMDKETSPDAELLRAEAEALLGVGTPRKGAGTSGPPR